MNTATKYGNYCALFCIGIIMVLHFAGVQPLIFMGMSTFLTFIVDLIFIFISIRSTRLKDYNGFIDFKNAAKAGLTTIIISTILVSFFIYLYYAFINPGFIDKFLPNYESWMKVHSKKSAEEMKEMLTTISTGFTPISAAWGTFSQTLFIETFIVLIFARFMRSNPPEHPNQTESAEPTE